MHHVISPEMFAVGEELRATKKQAFASVSATQELLAAPKTTTEPPASLMRDYDIALRPVGEFSSVAVTAPGNDPDTVVLYLHGGAFVNEIQERHWNFAGRLADAGVRVEVAIYPLLPRHTHRDAQRMVADLHQMLLTEFVAEKIVLAGDSSGGGLALAYAQSLIGKPFSMPGRLLLVSPWLDVTMTNPEIARIEPLDPWLSYVGLKYVGGLWAGGDDRRNPLVSPLYGPTVGLPPIDLHTGTTDLLYPDIAAFVERVTAAGGEIDASVVAGGYHDFAFLPCPEADLALAEMVRVLRPSN